MNKMDKILLQYLLNNLDYEAVKFLVDNIEKIKFLTNEIEIEEKMHMNLFTTSKKETKVIVPFIYKTDLENEIKKLSDKFELKIKELNNKIESTEKSLQKETYKHEVYENYAKNLNFISYFKTDSLYSDKLRNELQEKQLKDLKEVSLSKYPINNMVSSIVGLDNYILANYGTCGTITYNHSLLDAIEDTFDVKRKQKEENKPIIKIEDTVAGVLEKPYNYSMQQIANVVSFINEMVKTDKTVKENANLVYNFRKEN